MKILVRILFFFLTASDILQAQTATTIPRGPKTTSTIATPVEPIAAIVHMFESHPIVAIGNVEFRGNEQCHAFQLALIRDPGFTSVVNDIVVEFGNSRYQAVMDRFVQGEDVSYESLRQVWQNTTQVEFEWDLPIYEDFFRAVRTVNASLPHGRQLRVVLGDSPIDWAN